MLTKKHIAYLGIKKPSSVAQINVEISGLKYAIKVAEESIAELEQSLAIFELDKENNETQE